SHGSVSLPIRIEGTPRRRASNGPAKANFCGLAGATNSTPTTSFAYEACCKACAVARQPKLWAASTNGPRSRASRSRSDFAQTARSGASQSACSTRSERANCRSSHVCQCAPSLPCRPGTVTSRGGHVDLLHESMILLAAGIRKPIVERGPADTNQLFLICLLGVQCGTRAGDA